MIYVETFRHYAQEWIKVTPPEDTNREWPWDRSLDLFLLNLYGVSGPEYFTPERPPKPLVSIVIDYRDSEANLLPHNFILHSEYFQQSMYSLPRRFWNDLRTGCGQTHSKTFIRRGTFSSNRANEILGDEQSTERRVIRHLAMLKHQRLCQYGSHEYEILRQRLNEMADTAGIPIHCAEDLMDVTTRVTKKPPTFEFSPDLYIAAVPVIGYVKPIVKSKEYRLINGAYVSTPDEVRLSIEEEPCHHEYDKVRVPFADLQYKTRALEAMAVPNVARGIVYMVVETPCGSFTMQEFRPSDIIRTSSQDYVRVLNHHFHVEPELYDSVSSSNTSLVARLKHTIEEGIVPKTRENKQFMGHFSPKLFHRTNLPPGYVMRSDGTIETKIGEERHS